MGKCFYGIIGTLSRLRFGYCETVPKYRNGGVVDRLPKGEQVVLSGIKYLNIVIICLCVNIGNG